MQKIVNGKKYDTETATLIGEDSYGNTTDFHFWKEALYKAHETGADMEPLEAEVNCKDGSPKQVELRMASKGMYDFILFIDISHRKEAEKKLQEIGRAHV